MSTKTKADKHPPYAPAPYEPEDAAAFQALQKGIANGAQQQRAIKWLIYSACRTYDLSYRPGEEGRRDTDFAEGVRSVGLQIVFLLNLKIGLLTRRQQ